MSHLFCLGIKLLVQEWNDTSAILARLVVRLGAFGVVQPLFEYRTQLAGVLVAQLEVLEAADRCLTEHAAVSLRQRITWTCTDNDNHRSRIRILRIFPFLKFKEFYSFFSVERYSVKIHIFANHRCLSCFDVLECKVHL